MPSRRRMPSFLVYFALLLCCAQSGIASAQATLDHLLATVTVSGEPTCSTIHIRLNRPVSYVGHFPVGEGSDVAIRIEPIATTLPNDDNLNLKEAASVAPGNPAGLTSVSFDPFATSGPVIRLEFARTTAFRVTMDRDTRLLRVDASRPENARKCLGHAASSGKEAPVAVQGTKTDGQNASGGAAAALKEGKSLLAAGDFARAALFFTKAVSNGSGSDKQDAQEMLGLARERAGQLAHAKAEYETYLKLYPKSDSAARVRDRLNGVLASMDETAEKQFAKHQLKRSTENPEEGSVLEGKGESSPPGELVSSKGNKTNFNEKKPDPNDWIWEKNGSVAQYYYRDDNFSASDPSKGTLDRHEIYQNEVLSSGDFYLRGDNNEFRTELRASLYNERGFGDQSDIHSTNVGTLYVDGLAKDSGLSARLGRQSKSTGGVFGRFDGALFGWEPQENLELQAVVGSPVYSRDAMPFTDDRLFYGASIDYTFPGEAWSGSIYILEQDIKEVIDRRAVGAELRYFRGNLSAYAAADYDIFYEELNNAYVSGTWNITEGSTIYATADFRRVPFLLTSNALMGQTETNLSSLVEIFGEDSVEELATDRTATSKTLTIGGTQQLSKDWQLAIDATIADYSGTPASGGVDEIPDPGIEYYASLQLTGSNILKESDTLTFALRYSDSEASSMYMADAFFRFPVTDDLRISPRLRAIIRDSKDSDRMQFLLMPSIATRYRLNKSWSFDMEVGARLEEVLTADDDQWNLDVLARVVSGFYA
jgi:hypothetical protein